MATPSGAVLGAAALLERSITYLLGNLALVDATALNRSTPCPGWTVAALLTHVDDTLVALALAAHPDPRALYADQRPDSRPFQAGPQPADLRDTVEAIQDPIAGVRATARLVRGGWSAPALADSATIAGLPISMALVGAAGAIEIAAHGWDVARSVGWRRPVPVTLAEEMLDLLPLLLPEESRDGRFARPVGVPPSACAGDRLIAFLGRQPPGPVERRYLQSRAALLLARGG